MQPTPVNPMYFHVLTCVWLSVLGLINGIFLAVIYRDKKGRLFIPGMILLSCLCGAYFGWYALGYNAHGTWALWLAYASAGIMVAQILAVIPLAVLAVGGRITRKREWAEKLSSVVLIGAATLGIFGAVDGDRKETVTHITITSPDIPEEWDGFKLVQITDTHIGPYYRAADLDLDLERAKAEGAQMIAFTGDLIDDVRYMPQAADTLTRYASQFPYGIYYVWGNHEYYRGKAGIEKELQRTPVHLLVNEHAVIYRDGAPLYLAGVDFPFERDEALREEDEEQMTEAAWKGIPADEPVIFLAHHSDFIASGSERKAILTLTGHTHGMQFGIFGQPIYTPYVYTRGMYSYENQKGYVSRGNGGWFPVRLGCSREMAVFTLKHGKTEN
jgi:predicted MPP superfamily phosphohydrolase